jgi:hypothetical protein
MPKGKEIEAGSSKTSAGGSVGKETTAAEETRP